MPKHLLTAFFVTALTACTATTSGAHTLDRERAATPSSPRAVPASGADPLPRQQEEARAEETRVVFAAVLCAYEEARTRIGAAHLPRLEEELARIRGIFRAAGAEPRPCSHPLVARLAGCIGVWPESGEILSEWRSDGECASAEVAAYK